MEEDKEKKADNLEKESSISIEEIEKRKKKIIHFLKEKSNLIVYALLSVILFISVYIRTRNISKLKDITTGTWTLGPDLDPFLFLRWAKYIAEHGRLFLLDTMRYVPLANICSGDSCTPINTANEMKLLSYMIVWLGKFLSAFNKEVTITYAAIIFPVVMAVLTGIAFFLFSRKLFYKEEKKIANIIALISTAFFILVPSLLPRTIAGIPEKESAAFFFIFIGLYFFLEAFTSEKLKRGLIFGFLAGVSTGVLNLIWGGGTVIFVIIYGAVFFAFLLEKIDQNKFYVFSIWIVGFIMLMAPFSVRYGIKDLLSSTSTALCFITFFILLIDFAIFNKKIFNLHEKLRKIKFLPHQIISIILGGIILIILASIFFRVSFVPNIIQDIISNAIHPISRGRFSITVAENRQSYFMSDWVNEFGPVVFNIPLYFWLFFIGSVFLFNYAIKILEKKEKKLLTVSYVLLLICLVFSKYSSKSVLNGDSGLSFFVYFGGILIFIGSLIYCYYKRYKEEKLSIFRELNFGHIIYLITIVIMIIAARGAVRLIMVLGAVSPVAIAFIIIKSIQTYLKEKEEFKRLLVGIVVLIILIASIFTIWAYYTGDKGMAENYAPSVYTNQWQRAMAWVRENTAKESVFAHWWDYGYWLQSLGERATILDGGNAIGYWNYFMGRHVLTGTDERTALDFLYAHNGTHLLIDSTEIGKYGAFSSIGSNSDYDRYSWIPTIFLDERQTQEKNNETMQVYPVGSPLDQDLIFIEEGKEILFPQKKTIVAAVVVKENNKKEMLQPAIFFMYNGKQHQIPLKYLYSNGKLYSFDSGFNGGAFIFPKIDTTQDGKLSIIPNGAALYLSERTINSQLARLYLFNEKSDFFKLVHTEEDLFIESINTQGANVGNFVYYQGFRGPIKIWEVSYPGDITLNQSYLNTEYPPELETITSEGY